jgi:hypothetical protein
MRLRTLVVALSALVFIPASAVADDSLSGLNTQIESGKNVIVLFVSDKEAAKYANSEDDGEIEFYSDWYFYLGSFVKDQGSKATVYKISAKEGRQFFHSDKVPKDEWSIVFIKKGRPVLYSRQPIMEPDVFQFASNYFDGKEDPKQAKQFGLSYITLR